MHGQGKRRREVANFRDPLNRQNSWKTLWHKAKGKKVLRRTANKGGNKKNIFSDLPLMRGPHVSNPLKRVHPGSKLFQNHSVSNSVRNEAVELWDGRRKSKKSVQKYREEKEKTVKCVCVCVCERLQRCRVVCKSEIRKVQERREANKRVKNQCAPGSKCRRPFDRVLARRIRNDRTGIFTNSLTEIA